MISAATRLSAHPKTTAVGRCSWVRLARCSMLWLGCWGSPATNRSLPSLSAFHAFTGLVFGMGDIVHGACERVAVSIDPREVVHWFDRVRRDLPWRRPEVSAWQILVSEFML